MSEKDHPMCFQCFLQFGSYEITSPVVAGDEVHLMRDGASMTICSYPVSDSSKPVSVTRSASPSPQPLNEAVENASADCLVKYFEELLADLDAGTASDADVQHAAWLGLLPKVQS